MLPHASIAVVARGERNFVSSLPRPSEPASQPASQPVISCRCGQRFVVAPLLLSLRSVLQRFLTQKLMMYVFLADSDAVIDGSI